MCLEIMNTNSKRTKTDCLRKAMKPGSKLRWSLLRVSTTEDEALKKPRRTGAVRKYLRREQKRAQLAKLVLGELIGKEEEIREPVVCEERHPAGSMAPENTTQYLMGNVYADLKANRADPVPRETSAQLYGGSLSPRGVYAELDSGYESCLAFQQRDFEEAFGLCW